MWVCAVAEDLLGGEITKQYHFDNISFHCLGTSILYGFRSVSLVLCVVLERACGAVVWFVFVALNWALFGLVRCISFCVIAFRWYSPVSGWLVRITGNLLERGEGIGCVYGRWTGLD